MQFALGVLIATIITNLIWIYTIRSRNKKAERLIRMWERNKGDKNWREGIFSKE